MGQKRYLRHWAIWGSKLWSPPEQQLTVVRLGKTQDDVLEPMSAQIGRIMALFPIGS